MNETQVIKNIDDFLTVDINKKIINIPESEKLLGVENESAAERKYFLIPLMLGNNLSVKDMEIRIIYRDPTGIDDAYFVTDKTVDLKNGTVVFSWEIGRNVTQFKGIVEFALCLIKTDLSGMITNEWHTQFAKAEVKGGPSCAFLNEIPLEPVEDIVAKLIKKMQAEADKQIERIQQAGGGKPSGNGLTQAQINALAGMFSVCAYNAGNGDVPDPTKLQAIQDAKQAFNTAFNVGGEPPVPPTPTPGEKGIEQIGDKLVIKSGVIVTQQGNKISLS